MVNFFEKGIFLFNLVNEDLFYYIMDVDIFIYNVYNV